MCSDQKVVPTVKHARSTRREREKCGSKTSAETKNTAGDNMAWETGLTCGGVMASLSVGCRGRATEQRTEQMKQERCNNSATGF